jgi:hypothetical protein
MPYRGIPWRHVRAALWLEIRQILNMYALWGFGIAQLVSHVPIEKKFSGEIYWARAWVAMLCFLCSIKFNFLVNLTPGVASDSCVL